MVRPDKLLRVVLGLGMHLPSNGHGIVKRDVAPSIIDRAAGAVNNDLVRFHSTLKIARRIVEGQQQSEMVEVPTEGLASVLDKIKVLEDEVSDLMNGRKPSLSAGDESIAAAAATGIAAGGDAGGAPAGTMPAKANENFLSPTLPTSAGGSSPDGVSGLSSSEQVTSAVQPSTGAIFSEQDVQGGDEDECAPEKLLYSLGGGSLQKRGSSVSGHPLFRRNANCTLENVSGSKEESTTISGRPDVTPVASVPIPLEGQESSSADIEDKDKDAAPVASTSPKASDEDSGDDPLPTAVSIDGKELPAETAQPSEPADAAEDAPPAAVTEGNAVDSTNPIFGPMTKAFGRPPGQRGNMETVSYPDNSPPLSAGDVLKEEKEEGVTTVVATSTLDQTSTTTMTRTMTKTIHLALSPSSNLSNEKQANVSLPASAAAEASSASVVITSSSETTEASKDGSTSPEGKSELTDNAESSVGAMKIGPTSASTQEVAAAPDAEFSGLQSDKPVLASGKSMAVEQESLLKNDTATQFPPVAEQISIPSPLLQDPTPFTAHPSVTPVPISRSANYMFNSFVNGSIFDTRSSGFKTIPTMREEVPVTEAQQGGKNL